MLRQTCRCGLKVYSCYRKMLITMIYASFMVLGIIANAQAASVYITVVRDLSEGRNYSLPSDISFCTSVTKRCFIGLNKLETKLEGVDSVSITFEETTHVFFLHTFLAFHDYTQLELHGAPLSKTVVECGSFSDHEGFGVIVANVSNFIASNIVFKKCGYYVKIHPHNFWSALVFVNSENAWLTSVDVQESRGFGVSIVNVVGNVSFENCLFSGNSNSNSSGGGMYFKITSTLHLDWNKSPNGVYSLLNCTFKNNKAHTSVVYPGFRGGGLQILFTENASNYLFRIRDCKFINNTALWGGGLDISLINSNLQQHNNC